MVGESGSSRIVAGRGSIHSRQRFEEVRSVHSISGKYNGKIYGLPESCSIRAVAYNVDYFNKAGIVPPQKASQAWTWDELVAAAKKAQQASGAKYALQFEKPSFDR